MTTIDIPFPVRRMKCVVCGVKIPTSGIMLCTTQGIALLACSRHVEHCDKLVLIFQAAASTVGKCEEKEEAVNKLLRRQ